jgi:hypothetical protein
MSLSLSLLALPLSLSMWPSAEQQPIKSLQVLIHRLIRKCIEANTPISRVAFFLSVFCCLDLCVYMSLCLVFVAVFVSVSVVSCLDLSLSVRLTGGWGVRIGYYLGAEIPD